MQNILEASDSRKYAVEKDVYSKNSIGEEDKYRRYG